MKLACDLIKPWLVPYSEGTLRVHRPSLHAAVRRHLSGCDSCRQDEVLLHKTAMALRRHGQMSSPWIGRRGRPGFPPDVPLSRRVLQSVQVERSKLVCRASRTARRAYPVLAYATSVALLCTFFAFLTQPSIARPWLEHYFLARPHAAAIAKRSVKTPPYPMHDPFAIPAAHPIDSAARLKAGGGDPFAPARQRSSLSKVRTASLSTTTGRASVGRTIVYGRPIALGQNDLQAREAMTTAEQAEDNRASVPVVKPVSVAPKPGVAVGYLVTPFENPSAGTSHPSTVVGRSVTLNDLGKTAAPTTNSTAPAQPKPVNAGTTHVPSIAPIPDAVPASADSNAAPDSSSKPSR